MSRLCPPCLAALLGLVAVAVPADARQRQATPPPPVVPVPVEQLPPPAVLPALGPALASVPAPVITRPLTLQEFAAAFHPAPGTYEVVLAHPKNGRPVPVCFTLPPGCPRVRVGKREIEFDYGKREVEIRFGLCGKVKVDYD